MTPRILAGLLFALAAPRVLAQEPPAADVKALLGKYQAERDAAVKTGVTQRFAPALLERADALAKKAQQALDAGRLLLAAETVRQARWQLPYQAPTTPTEHLARILGNPRLRHTAPVVAVAFSGDGQRLATASAEGTIKLWDAGNGHEIRTCAGQGDTVVLLASSPDGRRLASAGKGADVKLWDAATGKSERTLKAPEAQQVAALAFAPDGKTLLAGYALTAGKGQGGLCIAFDVETGARRRTDTDFRGAVTALAVTRAGGIVAASDTTGQVRLWQYPALIDQPKQPAYWTRQHNTGVFYAVAFSPDGKILACSTARGLLLYDTVAPGAAVQPGEPRHTLALPAFAKTLAFSRDGKVLFAGCFDGIIRSWDPDSGQALGTLKGPSPGIFMLAFNPAGQQLALAGGDYTVRLWDFDAVLTARDLARHDGPVWSAAFSPDGERIVTASADRTVRVWGLGGGKALLTIDGHNAPVTAAQFSPDGKFIASVGADKTLRLWDATGGAALRSATGHTGTITALDVAADSKHVATGGADRRIKIWDADTARELLSIDDNPSVVAAVAFRPDGKQLAVGNVDQTIALYEAATGKQQQRWTAHGGAVNCLAFSPSGQWLVSGGTDALVKVWPLANPGSDPVVLAGHAGPVSGVAFRKDNLHVASAGADQLVKLWKLEGGTGKEVQTFRGHKDWVTAVAFSPDGAFLVSSSVDRSAKLWEITSREAPLLAEHTSGITTLALRPDGKQLVTGSRDQTIKVWDRATGAELASRPAHLGGVTAVTYPPAGAPLISSGNDRMIRFWDPATLKELPRTAEQDLAMRNMIRGSPYLFVAPDSKRLLAWFPLPQANLSTIVECYELPTGRHRFNFKETNRKVNSLTFCADGKLVATGATDGSVRLWRLDDNRAEIAPGGDWDLFGKIGVADIALTPDGTTLIATSNKGEVKIADVAKRTVRQTLTAHEGAMIHSCIVSPDGKRFVTVGGDNLVKCWELASGKELRRWVMGPPPPANGGPLVSAIAFTPDNRQLVTANADTTVFVLDLPE